MGLRENAAAAAGRIVAEPDTDQQTVSEAPNLVEPDLGDLTADAEPTTSAVTAWSRVMGEVRAIGKNEKFEGGRAGRFNFRGIETALNAFGPACRKHGVLVIQHKVETEYRDISTSSGGRMRECTALVTFRIYGPDGSFFETQAAGEASDSGGRSTPKAQSIALRTLLINNGLVPTEDRDADAVHFERAESPVRPAASYVDEVCNPHTSAGRLRQIHHELSSTRQLGALVTNEVGDEERIGDMVVRIGKERTAGGAE
ncbi:ERF superfamily protein [Streptomyces sp. TverLS-915]|uniref:ERF family protein n=1 Tax=Streptomyces sp. TverLS-915 TaxID=1839763 RepID=UPI00081DF423|nr:ERF family protein [Streptomyces sp. TverLS-915]SCD41289.1 ERF superfamily protein [Streptomyces sp. TverLS-915]